MEIIAVYNIKGGVGKTTTAINLAWQSAAAGWRTLIWDLDPQAAATYLLRGNPDTDAGAKQIIRGEQELDGLVQTTAFADLELIPADTSYRRMDIHLDKRKRPAERLMKLMRPLHRRYACLVLDCAPGLSLVSENVIRAADALVVPLLPSPLSVRTLEQLLDHMARTAWEDLALLPFFSMVDRRRRLHRDMIAALRTRFPMILDTEVPYGSGFEQIAIRRAPIGSFAPASPEAAVYRRLWQEIDARLAAAHGQPRAAAAQESTHSAGEAVPASRA